MYPRIRHAAAVAAVAVLIHSVSGTALASGATTVEIEPLKDNTLFDMPDPTSNGAGPNVFSGRTGAGGGGVRQRAVLAFDVAGAIPAGSEIVSATLTVTLEMASPFGVDETHTLHRIEQDWGEGESVSFGGTGVAANADDATWDHTFFPDQFWISPGGDFEDTPSASAVIGTVIGGTTVWSSPEATSDVQGWLDAPASNFGWLVRGNEVDLNTAKKLHSRESPVVAARPRLTVEFLAPCPGDLDRGGSVDFADLLIVLSNWGCTDCPADIDGGGAGFSDLLIVLSSWGPCL